VLYVLPRPWTDRVLPLTLTPAPRELVRVMVGRAELISPACEQSLATQVERFGRGDEIARRQAVTDARALGLGRFMEAALRRLIQQQPDNRALSTAGWELLQAVAKPDAPPRTASLRERSPDAN
jgi:hypothetical protein